MIYTVTLNPALDYVIRADHFKAGQINRTASEHIYFGGKGVNVSYVLKQLDTESTALGFIAGFTGKALKEGLEKEGIRTCFTDVKTGMTRINVKLKSDEETEINGRGPLITEEEFNDLLEKTGRLKAGDVLILSGSIPSCMKSDAYERIIESVKEDVMIIADAEKDLLMKILKYRPFLIKPNHKELGDLFGTEITCDEEAVACAEKLQKLGAANVLVSMAAEGAVLISEDGTVLRQYSAKGDAVNSVGAGDSMVAGFTAGFLKTNDFAYALKLSAACGAATAFHSGLAVRSQILEVLEKMSDPFPVINKGKRFA